MEYCVACTMPLASPEVVGARVVEGSVCIHCADENGNVKSCAEIFEGGVQFFLGKFPELDRAYAERVTRKNMRNLPYWQNRKEECLQGEEATEEEFRAIFEKLQ